MQRLKSLGIFLATITLIFSYGCTAETATPTVAPPPENTVWIDVRTAEEYSAAHISEASNIPYEIIVAGVTERKLAKDTPIYLYCRSGHRAGIAKAALEEQNYTHVVNVGGLEDARAVLEKKAE